MAFNGTGSNVTALNASNISSGTVATARLASGTANSSTFLRGDSTWAAGVSGPTGPAGSPGPAGPPGPTGPAGPTNTGFNQIGTYSPGNILNTTQYNAGSTVAGSSILSRSAGTSQNPFDNVNTGGGTQSNLGRSGTWRAMSQSKGFAQCGITYGNPNLWVRIS
jgi:hypothetical protein